MRYDTIRQKEFNVTDGVVNLRQCHTTHQSMAMSDRVIDRVV